MSNRQFVTSILIAVTLGVIIISSIAPIVLSAPMQLPPRRPIPPAPGSGDPPNIKKVVLPKTLDSPLAINGEEGWVEIIGSTTINFNNTWSYYGIRIYNAERIIIKNVQIKIASFKYYITPFYIVGSGAKGTSVVGDKLVIDFNGKAKAFSWGYVGFSGIRAYRVNSFKLNTILIKFHPKIESDKLFWKNPNYNVTYIGGYGAYIYLYTNSYKPAKLNIGSMVLTYNPVPANEKIIIILDGWIYEARIRAHGPYNPSVKGIQTYGEATIRTIMLKNSAVNIYYSQAFSLLVVDHIKIRINNLVMNNIRIGRRIIEDVDSHKWNYGYIAGLYMYRSKVYVDRIIGYNVIMGTSYGEAYILDSIYRSIFTYRYILTRNFGTGKGNITGGVVPIIFPRSIKPDIVRAKPSLLNGGGYIERVRIEHAFFRNAPTSIGPSGIRSLKGYLSISTKASGYVALYKNNGEGISMIYRGPLKNSRVKIVFNQEYNSPHHNVIILYTGNIISLMVIGTNIKITINDKTYTVDAILLSSSDARIRGMLFMNRYDGSSVRVMTRVGIINGIYNEQAYISGGE